MKDEDQLSPQEEWMKLRDYLRPILEYWCEQLKCTPQETKQITEVLMEYYFGGTENNERL